MSALEEYKAFDHCGASYGEFQHIADAMRDELLALLRLVFDDYPEVSHPGDSFEEWLGDLRRREDDKRRVTGGER